MGTFRLRARLAAVVLVGAPSMLVVVGCLGAGDAGSWRMGAEWVGFGAWIPAVLCLEHFLKKVADGLAALANGLGLVGSWLGASAAAAEWGLGLGADGDGSFERLQQVKLLANMLLACAWLVFAWGHGKHRLVPWRVSVGVAVAAVGWVLGRALGVPILESFASGFLTLCVGWIGLQLLRSPERWNQPFVVAPGA